MTPALQTSVCDHGISFKYPCVKCGRNGTGDVLPLTSPFGTHLGYTIETLKSYATPYYYAVGPTPLGSIRHFPTIKRLQNYMNRMVKAGKLSPKVTP